MGGQGCRLDLGPGDNAFEENTELLRVVKVRSLSLSFCPRKRIVRRFVVEISELLRVVEVRSGLAAAGICLCAARIRRAHTRHRGGPGRRAWPAPV